MKRHHVQITWEGTNKLSARCRCGWAGARHGGDDAWSSAERDARAHEQAVREGNWPNYGKPEEDQP